MVLNQRTVEQRDDRAQHRIAAHSHGLLGLLRCIQRRIAEHGFSFEQHSIVEGEAVILTLVFERCGAFETIGHLSVLIPVPGWELRRTGARGRSAWRRSWIRSRGSAFHS